MKEITIDLKDDEQNCPRCGEPMKKMGTKPVHELLIYRLATLYRSGYRTTSYECRCPEPEEPKIALTEKVPAAPLQGSYAGSKMHSLSMTKMLKRDTNQLTPPILAIKPTWQ